MPKRNSQLKKNLMEKICDGKITMHSRYRFLAEQLGIKSLLVLTFFLALFFVSLFFYLLQNNNALIYFSLGSMGLWAFLEAFPFQWIFIAVLCFIVLSVIWEKNKVAYAYSYQNIMVVLLTLVFLGGTVSAFFGLHRTMEDVLANSSPEVFCSLFSPPKKPPRYHLAGEIKTVGNKELIISNAFSEQITVRFKLFPKKKMKKNEEEYSIGQTVFLRGTWVWHDKEQEKVFWTWDEEEEKIFEAHRIHMAPRNDARGKRFKAMQERMKKHWELCGKTPSRKAKLKKQSRPQPILD